MRYEVDITLTQRWVMAIEAEEPSDAQSIGIEKLTSVPASETRMDVKVEKGADR